MSILKLSTLGCIAVFFSGSVNADPDRYEDLSRFEPQNQFPFKEVCAKPGEASSRFETGLVAISSNDHADHAMQMDHSGHGGQGHADHAMDHDEHAHHRAMMKNRDSYSSKTEHYALPAIQLVSQDGAEYETAQVFDGDSPVMVNFIFTTCTTICPVLSATFTEVQEILGDEAKRVKMVSVTIDPEYDTPEKLKEYAERYSAQAQWSFFTGDVGDIIALERAFKVYRGNKMAHEPTTLIRMHKDDSWLRLDGFASAQDVVKEYRKLAVN